MNTLLTSEMRLRLAKINITEPWTMANIDQAVRDLKTNKSRDASDQVNELFQEGVASSDLKFAIQKLMNHIKAKHEFPEVLESCNITSLYNHKGSHNDFNNCRGVF